MQGLATDDATERNRAVVRLAGGFRCIQRNRQRRRDFKRARDGQPIERCASFFRRGSGAGQQGVGNIFIKARFHNQDARSANKLLARRSARLGHNVISTVKRW